MIQSIRQGRLRPSENDDDGDSVRIWDGLSYIFQNFYTSYETRSDASNVSLGTRFLPKTRLNASQTTNAFRRSEINRD